MVRGQNGVIKAPTSARTASDPPPRTEDPLPDPTGSSADSPPPSLRGDIYTATQVSVPGPDVSRAGSLLPGSCGTRGITLHHTAPGEATRAPAPQQQDRGSVLGGTGTAETAQLRTDHLEPELI